MKKILLFFVIFLISCSQQKFTGEIVATSVVAGPKEHWVGDPHAPNTVIEYIDFECLYTNMFYREVYPEFKSKYIDTGIVRLQLRHLPLNSIHAHAHKAAEATECANLQGKFWEMADMIFKYGVGKGIETYKQYAIDIGIDKENFNECIDSDRTRQIIIDDFNSGMDAGVRGTPAFVINGKTYSGVRDMEFFEARFTDEAKPVFEMT